MNALFLLPLLTVVFGVLLYWVRSRCRFWYGVCELIAAVLLVIFISVPHQVAYIDEPPFWEPWAWSAVGWLAGLYVFVRGMDNIGQDLPASWLPLWRSLFFPSTPPAPTS